MFRQPEPAKHDDIVVVLEGTRRGMHAQHARRGAAPMFQESVREQAKLMMARPIPAIEAEPDPSLAIALAIAMLEAEQ